MGKTKTAAGLLLYRRRDRLLEVFLIHPGGPLFAARDAGCWSIPKGEYDAAEAPLDAAKREFEEETGFRVDGEFTPLTPVQQRGGKLVSAWAIEGDCDPAALRSNTFTIEWPPGSGRRREFPEVDRGQWFRMPEAREKIKDAQTPLLAELERLLS